MNRRRGWVAVGGSVARRPSLWSTAARQARRLAPARWWRTAPFVPMPAGAWLRFRSETQYGNADRLEPDDVVVWLEWARATDRRKRTPAFPARR